MAFLLTILTLILRLARHLWLGFEFGALQYLQFCSIGLVPYFLVCVILCIGSSLNSSFDFFDFGLILVRP